MNDGLTYLSLLMAPYEDARMRLEIRPLHPAWRESDLYPEGNTPASWPARTPFGVRQWFALTEGGLRAAGKHCGVLAARYEVYCGVLPRVGRTGRQENVSGAGWLWCDVDGGIDGVEGAGRLLDAADLPCPHMVVVSGNGLHVYWRLAEVVVLPDSEARGRFKQVLHRLCKAIGGTAPGAHADCSRAEVASILRVPGTRNNKRRERPKAVRLEAFTPAAETHSLNWWRAYLPTLPAPRAAKPCGGDPMAVSAGLLRWAKEPVREGDRHKTLCAAAAWLIRDVGIERGQVLELLSLKAAASPGSRTITRAELEAVMSWVK